MNLVALLKEFQPSRAEELKIVDILKKSGCTQPQFHSFFTAESKASFAHLKELVFLKPDQSLEEKIRSFLKKRWNCIANTNLSYVSFPHSPINQICIQLAQEIVKPEEPLALVLMPSLKMTDYMIASADLIQLTEVIREGKRELNFSNFIPSEDLTAIIPIQAWFEAQANNIGYFFNHLYSLDDEIVPLSEEEKILLRQSAMPASDEFFEELDFRKQLISEKGTLAEALTNLCDRLKENGQSGIGHASRAAPGAYDATRVFLNIWYRILSQEQRDSLESMGNDYKMLRKILLVLHASLPHNNEFGMLSQEEINLIKNTETCVEVNAATLENILSRNPEAFSKIIINKSEAAVNRDSSSRQVTPFDSLLQNIQSKIDARNKAIQDYQISKDPLAGENALKLHYRNEIGVLGEFLHAYSWDLANSLDELPPYPVKTEAELSYFQHALSDQEMASFLSRQDNAILQQIYELSSGRGNKLTEFLLLQPYFTPHPAALHEAVKNNRVDLVKAFIQGGKNLHYLENSWGGGYSGSPLYYALESKKEVIAALLIQAGARCVERIGSSSFLFYAVRANFEPVIDALLEREDIKINEKDSKDKTVLHYAAVDHHANRCEALIKKGARIDAVDQDGNTALHIAACHNRDDIAQILLKFKADMNIKNKENLSALALAMNYKSLNSALALIEAGADLSETYGYSKKPIFVVASELQSIPILYALLKNQEVKVDDKDSLEETALLLAVKRGDYAMVRFLIENKAEVNLSSKHQYSPLYHAIMGITSNNISVACALIIAGGDLNYCFKKNETEYRLIEYASQKKIRPIFFAWVDQDNDPAILPADTLNALLHSILDEEPYPKSFEKYIKKLIIAGATDPNLLKDLHFHKIHFRLDELLSNPHLDKLKTLHSFDALCGLCQTEPDSENALKLYAACQEIKLRKLPGQVELANTLHQAIRADSLENLYALISSKQSIGSSYTRAEPSVDLWEEIPQALQELVRGKVAVEGEKIQLLAGQLS